MMHGSTKLKFRTVGVTSNDQLTVSELNSVESQAGRALFVSALKVTCVAAAVTDMTTPEPSFMPQLCS